MNYCKFQLLTVMKSSKRFMDFVVLFRIRLFNGNINTFIGSNSPFMNKAINWFFLFLHWEMTIMSLMKKTSQIIGSFSKLVKLMLTNLSTSKMLHLFKIKIFSLKNRYSKSSTRFLRTPVLIKMTSN